MRSKRVIGLDVIAKAAFSAQKGFIFDPAVPDIFVVAGG
jgi:hypothetical protein